MKEHEWKVGDRAMWEGEEWKVDGVFPKAGVAAISRRLPRPFRTTTCFTVALSLLKPAENPELKPVDVVWYSDGSKSIFPPKKRSPYAIRRITVNPNHPTAREMADAGFVCYRPPSKVNNEWLIRDRTLQLILRRFPDAKHNNDPGLSFDAAMRWINQQIDKETSDA